MCADQARGRRQSRGVADRPGQDRRVAELSTPRLVLRPWRDSDLDVFAALNADAEMMRDLEGRDDVVADGDVITVRSTP
jgi:hypothetical protein